MADETMKKYAQIRPRDKKGKFVKDGGKKSELRNKPCPDCGMMIMRKSKYCRSCANKMERHPGWKGEKIGYSAIHYRIRKLLGKPNKCGMCGSTTAKDYDWANKSGQYKFDKNDWLRLCVTCHKIYDGSKGGDVHEFQSL